VQGFGQLGGGQGAGQQAGALERDQALAAHRRDLVEHGFDPWTRVNGHRHDREILGQREQALSVEVMLAAKALDPPQHDARLEAVALVQVE
jgi:hypothetical protein